MKILNFLFRDFWRNLVALIFAVVIYWQVSGVIKQKEAMRDNPAPAAKNAGSSIGAASRRDMDFTVRILDGGAERRAVFAPGTAPKVKAALRGTKHELDGIKDGDLVFYVDVPADLKSGERMLPVSCHIRRRGVEVLSMEPAELKIIANPVENHK